jgi:ubiquitin-protein ligase E3 C
MGIDGGGVFKEFLTRYANGNMLCPPLSIARSLVKEVFDTDRGLWLENTQRELYPNPHSYAVERQSHVP